MYPGVAVTQLLPITLRSKPRRQLTLLQKEEGAVPHVDFGVCEKRKNNTKHEKTCTTNRGIVPSSWGSRVGEDTRVGCRLYLGSILKHVSNVFAGNARE